MTKREKRVISAFINCVKAGVYAFDYAVTLMESDEKYGYLTEEAKELFYIEFEKEEDIDEESEEK
ncbi:MAG: hypothetical protein IKT50_03220 [Clostridia bacterium]|nr:hypothetical protein [Clostridia bacterium]